MLSSSSSVRPSGTVSFSRGVSPQKVLEALEAVDQSMQPEVNEGDGGDGNNGLYPTSLYAWVGSVLKDILRSRTPFGLYISRCISSCRGRHGPPSTALFPIPLPLDDAWLSRLLKPGKSRRDRLAVRRALSLVICGLNYVYLSAPLSPSLAMQRCPSPAHLGVYRRLTALIKAGGPSGVFSSLGCGRKSHQLDARLSELSSALQRLGLGEKDFYKKDAVFEKVPQVNNREELVPYRPLDPSRLKLTGRGHWDCRKYLGDLLYLPFLEPRINVFDITPPADVCPDLSSIR